jgi:hypothetical protein
MQKHFELASLVPRFGYNPQRGRRLVQTRRAAAGRRGAGWRAALPLLLHGGGRQDLQIVDLSCRSLSLSISLFEKRDMQISRCIPRPADGSSTATSRTATREASRGADKPENPIIRSMRPRHGTPHRGTRHPRYMGRNPVTSFLFFFASFCSLIFFFSVLLSFSVSILKCSKFKNIEISKCSNFNIFGFGICLNLKIRILKMFIFQKVVHIFNF